MSSARSACSRRAKRVADVVVTSPLLVIKVTHWEIRRLSAETIAKLEAIVDAAHQGSLNPGQAVLH